MKKFCKKARKECEKFPQFLINNQIQNVLEDEEINTDFITKYQNLIE